MSKHYHSRRFPQLNQSRRQALIKKLTDAAPGLRRDSRIQLHASISVGFALLVVAGLVAVGNVLNQLEPTEVQSTGIIIEPAGEVGESHLRQLVESVTTSIAAQDAEDELTDLELRSLRIDTTAMDEVTSDSAIPFLPEVKPIPLSRPELPLPEPEFGL
ncbi:MAG: hypothetical protein LR015_03965 [Verrucomicrobia bacterium]|nr:hypothetical protein [Verrucomicrobiota bacterium]